MAKRNRKRKQLEDTIGQVQNVLDNAQHVLTVADKTQKTAGAVATIVRRIVFLVIIGGAVFAALAAVRRRQS